MAHLMEWKQLEQSKWGPLPCLGIEWMVKWCANDRGYQVMVTDSCGLWGECRGAKYVVDKAEDWAPCIEAGIKDISSLVLSEVSKMDVKVEWVEGKQTVNLEVASELNSLSYRWEFQLNRLSDDLFKHHWVTPLFIQMHNMGLKIKQLTSEVEHKQRQIEELLPDNKQGRNNKTSKVKDNLSESTEAVCVQGPWMALKDHLNLYPDVMQRLSDHQNQKLESHSKSKSRKTMETPVTAHVETEEEIEQREAEEERKRREEIQKLTQDPVCPPTPSKKKKKLKI